MPGREDLTTGADGSEDLWEGYEIVTKPPSLTDRMLYELESVDVDGWPRLRSGR